LLSHGWFQGVDYCHHPQCSVMVGSRV